MTHENITEEDLKKLAQDMVATANLSTLYGLDVFMKAKTNFECALKQFAAQREPAPPPEKPPLFKIETGIYPIPDILKNQ